MLTPDNQAKDYYPAPGEYDVAATTSMTRATPHYPLVKGVPTKIFGSQPQRPTSNESTSPVRARSSLGPGSYNVEKKLGSDLPGARIDYHASYQKIAIDLVEGRKEMGELFHGMVVLSKESNGVFSQNDDTDGDNGAYSIPSATIKPRDETANRFQTPAPARHLTNHLKSSTAKSIHVRPHPANRWACRSRQTTRLPCSY